MIELNKEQLEAVKIAVDRYHAGEKYTVIAGPAGTGKAQPVNTVIPTPSGFKTLGSLKEGDLVFDRHGQPTTVIGVYPQGQQPVYRVLLEDGRVTHCAGDHLWSYYDENGALQTEDTYYMVDHFERHKFLLPVNGPVEYPEYIEKRTSLNDWYHRGYNAMQQIPNSWKHSSIEQRWALVQGAMDSRGLVGHNRDHNIFLSLESAKLAADYQEILASLGYSSKRMLLRMEGETSFNLHIHAPNKEKFRFFLHENQDKLFAVVDDEDTDHAIDRVGIKSITPLQRSEEMVCILVDNPEHLYLTNDYIVTHNTTVVNTIIQELGVHPSQVCFCAYTGKACNVLRQKGNDNIQTLHKLLYRWSYSEEKGYTSKRVRYIDYKVLVVDECSMVGPDILKDLMSLRDVYTIFLGDNAQIPPVKDSDNKLLNAPHAQLTEIMRQATDNEIIKFATDVRLGKGLPARYQGTDVRIYQNYELTPGMLLWADQIICSTNKTRKELNNRLRELKQFNSTDPQPGDKIICLHNDWHETDDDQNPLVNGTIGYVTNISKHSGYRRNLGKWVDYYVTDMHTEDDTNFSLRLDADSFLGDEPGVPIEKNSKGRAKLEYFTYGYAITTWKAQGSQWDKVLIIEEGFPFDKDLHQRVLYTAITRAAKKVVIIRR